jgi:hypothetical protein
MTTPFFDLVHRVDKWVLVERETKKDILEKPTKEEALEKSVDYVKRHNGELVIHTMDGKIEDRRSYGNDPKGRG